MLTWLVMSLRSRLAWAGAFGAAAALPACSLALDFDATSAQPSPNTGFCRSHASPPAVFCDDFDATPLGTKWPAVEQQHGSVRNDGAAARSAPNSLLSSVEPVAAGERARAVGSVAFPALTSAKVGLRISFAMRVDQFDRASGAKNVVFGFLYGPLDDYNQIALNLVSTETAVSLQVAESSPKVGDEPGRSAQHGPFTTKPPLHDWTTIAIDFDINDPLGRGNALRVSLDGKLELDTQLTLPLKGDTPRLELGVGWVDTTEPTQTWVVRYDDFLVEAVTLR
jgi:hypothetical protein